MIVAEAAAAIERRINSMMGSAADVVYGPVDCGGYGVDKTPAGMLRAAALIAGDAYLYSVWPLHHFI